MSPRHRSRRLLLLAGLPLLCLPLHAAEPPPPPAAQQPADATAPAQDPKPAPGEDDAPSATEPRTPPATPSEEEQVSLDSNLSFPVDI